MCAIAPLCARQVSVRRVPAALLPAGNAAGLTASATASGAGSARGATSSERAVSSVSDGGQDFVGPAAAAPARVYTSALLVLARQRRL